MIECNGFLFFNVLFCSKYNLCSNKLKLDLIKNIIIVCLSLILIKINMYVGTYLQIVKLSMFQIGICIGVVALNEIFIYH
jgi:hypothetical protein